MIVSSGVIHLVIPAKAGIHGSDVRLPWIPAFAGMTNEMFQSEAIMV